VTPVDGSEKCALPALRAPGTANEQREPVVQGRLHLLRSKGSQPRRGQFQRERYPVQVRRDRADGRLGGLVECEGGLHEARAIHEQRQRIVVGQGRNTQHRLTRYAQRLAAGDQDGDVWAGVQDGLHGAGDAVEQVFGVVEAQQRPPRGQMRAEGVHAPTDDRRANGLGDGLRHRCAVTHRGELNPPDAVGVPIGLTGGGLRRQPRLAGTTRPGQGHQPVTLQ
jgi:hypothetical protein